jgi:hypothetical protein
MGILHLVKDLDLVQTQETIALLLELVFLFVLD